MRGIIRTGLGIGLGSLAACYFTLLAGLLGFVSASPCGRPCREAREVWPTIASAPWVALASALALLAIALLISGYNASCKPWRRIEF